MLDEIICNLYIGNIWDAIRFEGDLIIWVAEFDEFTDDEKSDMMQQRTPVLHIPFMVYNKKKQTEDAYWTEYADIKKLDYINKIISLNLSQGKKILVVCAAGIERSPLVVIYYLYDSSKLDYGPIRFPTGFDSLEHVFEFVKKERPVIENRLHWLKQE